MGGEAAAEAPRGEDEGSRKDSSSTEGVAPGLGGAEFDELLVTLAAQIRSDPSWLASQAPLGPSIFDVGLQRSLEIGAAANAAGGDGGEGGGDGGEGGGDGGEGGGDGGGGSPASSATADAAKASPPVPELSQSVP